MKKAHLIGICGKAMGGLAVMYKEMGWEVTGSDEGFYDPVYSYLQKKGISFSEGYAAKNIPDDATCIVIGKHAKLVPESNVEVAAAFASDIPIKSLPQALGELMLETDNIVVAGSFGKSTCTSIITWCLLQAGKDPSYMIGAVPFGLPATSHYGTDSTFVIEGDEYPSSNWDPRSKFLHYNPKTILLTSGEHDHVNVFPTPEEYLLPYQQLVGLLPADGLLIASQDGAHVMSGIVPQTKTRTVTYGMNESADWYAKDILYGEKTTFTLVREESEVIVLTTTLLGAYNVENIVGCAALLLEKNLLTLEELVKGIESFQGVSGRLDRKTANSSVLVYEAFGSSPAKLAAAFSAIKLHFPEKKVMAVFEPHTFGWRNRLTLPVYVNAFVAADAVIVYEPPSHGSETHDQLTLKEIVSKIQETHAQVSAVRSMKQGLERIESILMPEHLVLIVTSGELGGMIPEIPRLVERIYPA